MSGFGKLSAVLVGGDKLRAALRQLGERAEHGLAVGQYLEANNIMAEAVDLAPIDTGALRGSGYVSLPKKTRKELRVELGFGGVAGKYALRQHEETTWKHPDGGEAKYLEKAVNRRAKDFLRNVAAFVRAAIAGNNVIMPGGGFPKDPNPKPPTQPSRREREKSRRNRRRRRGRR